ncbi:cysteine desulfurase [Aerococcus kribbianus]|uniref:Cysteine desulfurase n=1 Tax=Aerococcus kribbianus TaxID=2999064 RepID=A0A9X3FM09_9LACT|nr:MULTISPECIES: cysteine desulfurase [unclassified Aerococcus]MCZ0716694.1 cysteine desulfurase [Aerococcus sp. YH-aer221]MCZ0724982.1 cysteine desulfurase [Aerococcus sp. YH-aer222]
MALKDQAQVPGSNISYQLHPDCKKYTLRDYGFQESKQGNFDYSRPIKVHFKDKQSVLLKVQVDKNVEKLAINVTNENGLQSLNIYKSDKLQQFVAPLEAVLEDMVAEKVLAPVD